MQEAVLNPLTDVASPSMSRVQPTATPAGAAAAASPTPGPAPAKGKARAEEPLRIVEFNNRVAVRAAIERLGFADNTVTTSKYSLLSFVPRNLLEFFRVVANLYFLVISILQVGTNLSPTNPYTTITPLTVVLIITMVKNGIEDWKRHMADRDMNARPARRLHYDNEPPAATHAAGAANAATGSVSARSSVAGAGHHMSLRHYRWRNIEVGDIIIIREREEVPADVVILATSEEEARCFIETANLDGETNLKRREAVRATAESAGWRAAGDRPLAEDALARNVGALRGRIEYEPPNNSLYTFTGAVELDGGAGSGAGAGTASRRVPVRPENVILRGCMLRSCAYVFGLVIFTGQDTKLMRNSRPTPSKQSNVYQQVNRYIFLIFLIQFVLCIVSTILFGVWTNENKDRGVWYLGSVLTNAGADTIVTSFFTFLILYNNLVPISLYVSLDLIKVTQAKFIERDEHMCYEVEDESGAKGDSDDDDDDNSGNGGAGGSGSKEAAASAAGVSSGAPATPSKSSTTTPKGAVGGSAGTSPSPLRNVAVPVAPAPRILRKYAKARTSDLNEDLGQIEYIFSDKTGTLTRNMMEFRKCSIGGVAYGFGTTEIGRAAMMRAAASNAPSEFDGVLGIPSAEDAARMSNPSRAQAIFDPKIQFDDPRLLQHLAGSPGGGPNQAALIHEFLTLLSVCHTVIPERDEATGITAYRASSPDEEALVKAARCLGYDLQSAAPLVDIDVLAVGPGFRGPAPTSPGPASSPGASGGAGAGAAGRAERHRFEVVGVNEFNSTRKRMSVVVRQPDGSAVLYCKGADNVMFDLISDWGADVHRQPMKRVLQEHLRIFAGEGLRTLVLARRSLTARELAEWEVAYNAAAASMKNREEALMEVAARIESNMTLVGATAIEDKLQEGVPDAIATLACAGIKIWVLTGDKEETAINIGYACRLLNDDMTMIKLNLTDKSELRQRLHALVHNDDSPCKSRILERRAARGASSEGGGWLSSLCNACSLGGGGGGGRKAAIASSASAAPTVVDMVPTTTSSLGARRIETAAAAAATTAATAAAASSAGAASAPVLALVVDGKSLVAIFAEGTDVSKNEMAHNLLEVAQCCNAVIACRVSPSQKADIVSLVRKGVHPSPMTLAIGDGANDVNMIQTAQVGVGISGQEGVQAVNSSDYAIAQFRFLKRLLLVHGRLNYQRISRVILYSFYKNVTLVCMLFLFNFYTAFSGTTLFESFVQAGWNFFTALPILAVGVEDYDVPELFSEDFPGLYRSGQSDESLNLLLYSRWIANAGFHALLIFFLTLPVIAHGGDGDGIVDDMYLSGLIVYTCLLFAMQFKVMLTARTWSRTFVVFLVLSFAMFILFCSVYNVAASRVNPPFLDVFFEMLSRPYFWLQLLFMPITALVPDIALKLAGYLHHPSDADLVRSKLHGSLAGPIPPGLVMPGEEERLTNALRQYAAANDLDPDLVASIQPRPLSTSAAPNAGANAGVAARGRGTAPGVPDAGVSSVGASRRRQGELEERVLVPAVSPAAAGGGGSGGAAVSPRSGRPGSGAGGADGGGAATGGGAGGRGASRDARQLMGLHQGTEHLGYDFSAPEMTSFFAVAAWATRRQSATAHSGLASIAHEAAHGTPTPALGSAGYGGETGSFVLRKQRQANREPTAGDGRRSLGEVTPVSVGGDASGGLAPAAHSAPGAPLYGSLATGGGGAAGIRGGTR